MKADDKDNWPEWEQRAAWWGTCNDRVEQWSEAREALVPLRRRLSNGYRASLDGSSPPLRGPGTVTTAHHSENSAKRALKEALIERMSGLSIAGDAFQPFCHVLLLCSANYEALNVISRRLNELNNAVPCLN